MRNTNIPALLLCLLGGAAGCMPEARDSDAGPYAFAHQAIPVLLGRKPKGRHEIQMWGDLERQTSRATVIRLLMDRPEFQHHWREVLYEKLQVQREGQRDMQSCYGAPLGPSEEPGELAYWVASNEARHAFRQPWNMNDLVRSSIAGDNLMPAWIGHLFGQQYVPGPAVDDDNELRRVLFAGFEQVHLSRQLYCMGCHSARGSASGGDRSFLISGSLEEAVFGPAFDNLDVHIPASLFRTDARIRPNEESDALGIAHDPRTPSIVWGLAERRPSDNHLACGGFTAPTSDALGPSRAPIEGYLAGRRGRRGSVFDVAEALRLGADNLTHYGYLRRTASGVVNQNDGLAFEVSKGIVDKIWTEVTGSSLTIANGLSRNQEQRDIHWHLTEAQFVPMHYSLKQVLSTILRSRFVNRLPPQEFDGTDPYELPPVWDPWVMFGDFVGHDRNAMSESIHRYSADVLIGSLHHGLGWPAGVAFATNGAYPNVELYQSMGQHRSDVSPGSKEVQFGGLLAWEAQVGACARPTLAADWIDRLVSATATRHELTLDAAVRSLKGRLLGDTSLYGGARLPGLPAEAAQNEVAELEALFGAPLSRPAHQVADLEDRLRQLCGTYLTSPQFLLAGVPPPGIGQSAGPPDVVGPLCEEGEEDCTYQQMCNGLQSPLAREGLSLNCGADQLTVTPAQGGSAAALLEAATGLCPQGECGVIPWTRSKSCEIEPRLCQREVPACDPRCDDITCCGGRLPTLSEIRDSAFLAWADGGKVLMQQGVEILAKGKKAFAPLKQGVLLHTGDLLRLTAGSKLEVKTKSATFRTPVLGMPEEAAMPFYFVVTGPQALKSRYKDAPIPGLSTAAYKAFLRAPAHRLGSLGGAIPVPKTKAQP